MTDPDATSTTNWDHTQGLSTFEVPRVDTLLLVTATSAPYPKVINLSGESPPLLDSDRDRAVLRAFLTLALQRLDTQESDLDVHP